MTEQTIQVVIGIVVGSVIGFAWLWRSGQLKRRDVRSTRGRKWK